MASAGLKTPRSFAESYDCMCVSLPPFVSFANNTVLLDVSPLAPAQWLEFSRLGDIKLRVSSSEFRTDYISYIA